MADRRLVWNQVAAPDLSGASAAIARANQSFTSGLEGAQGILAKYDKGQIEKADNELLSDLAALGGEEEFDAFVDNGGLEGRKISADLRDHVLGMRSGFVDQAGVRARTDGTRANTGIRLAQEGRVAADHAYGVQNRDEMAGLSGALVGARSEARQFGNAGATPDTRLLLARTLQAEAGNQGLQGMVDVGSVIRNRAASGKYGEGIEGVILKPGQFSAWNSVTGYADGEQGQDMNFEPSAEALAAADAVLSGQYEDRTNGATHYYANIPGVSGTPEWANDSFKQIDGSHFFGNADGQRVSGNTGPISTGSRTPKRDAFAEALANSETLTPAQINKLLGQVNGSQAAGQALLDDAAARATKKGKQLVDELGSTVINEALNDPEVQTQEELIAAVRKDPRTQNLTESEILDLTTRASGIGEEGSGFETTLSPSVTQSPLVTGTQQLLESDLAAASNATPQARMIGSLPAYKENPTETLIEELGLGSDGQEAGTIGGLLSEGKGGFDKNDVTNLINDYARKFGVTPEVAGVAMREAFIRDPLTIAGFNANTLENRFPEADVKSIIEDSLSQNSIRDYREKALVREQVNTKATKIVKRISELQRAAAKGGNRQEIQQEIASLYTELATLRTDNAITAPNK